MKRVTDFAAGQKIAAWVVLDPAGDRIGKVQAHYGQSTVSVDVFDYNGKFQQGRASGYGYDRLTAALSGLQINGIPFSDHCGERLEVSEDGIADTSTIPIGYTFANFTKKRGDVRYYGSCYRDAGLSILKAHGYTVIQAI